MPATYSINNNTAYEAARLATIGDVLNQLPDNTNKLISPKDARDAIYSSWENSVFKQLTGSASIEYIGVDKNGLNNKILLGKKQLGGVDVLNSSLLNYSFNDTDIFFFNNKSGITPSNTKVSFLAGTNSVLYPYAPYINSYQGTSSLHLEIVNQTGDITIDSNTGRVSINNVTFPTKLETASASNGQILKYYNGRLIWDNNTINVASIGSTNSVTNITGSPVLVNGHSLELTESSPIIATFGNIEPGQTFSNAPLVEVVRQMLYPHLGPEVSLLINANSSGYTTSTVAEFGNITPAGVQLAWSITKKSDPVIFATLSNSYLGGFAPTLPISYAGMTSISGVSLGYTPSISMDYILSVYDSGVTNYPLDSMAIATGSSTVTYATASVTLDLVYPFFYGVNATNATAGPGVNSILGSLTKLVEGKSDKIVPLSGTGYIYFIYPSWYGDIDSVNGVFDENGFNISSSFTYSTYLGFMGSGIDSPSSYWSGISYSVYKHGPLNVGPLGDVNWEFNFGYIAPTTTTTTTAAPTTTTTTTAAPTTTTTTTTAAPTTTTTTASPTTTTTTTAAPTTTTTTTAAPTTTTTTAAPTTTTTTTAAPTHGWDPLYISPLITLASSNLDANIAVTGTASVLSLKYIKGGDEFMYSVIVDDGGGGDVLSVRLGIGMTLSDLNDQIGGIDNNSIGVDSTGGVWYGGVTISSLPLDPPGPGGSSFNYVTGDIVDVAYNYSAGLMWIRVNGGIWNNDPLGDPDFGISGLSFSVPANSSIWARAAASILSTSPPNKISLYGTYSSIPSGYTFIY